MSTHSLCFRAKIRKKVTSVHPSFTIQKWGVRGYSLHGLVFVMSELHSIRNRACRIWPILVPTLKCFGGICLFPLSRVLKELTVLAFLISSERLFQALIVERKNELKKIFVRVRID